MNKCINLLLSPRENDPEKIFFRDFYELFSDTDIRFAGPFLNLKINV